MPAGSLETLAADAGFPALTLATDADYLLPLFAHALGVSEGAVALRSIEVLNHKPGRRCTLAYVIESESGRRTITGKWYRDARQAHSFFERLQALTLPPASLALPSPLHVTDDGLVLQSYIEGRELRDLTLEGDTRPFAAAGEWLARLHAVAPPAGLRRKSRAHELSRIEGWCGVVAAAMPELAGDLRATMKGVGALAKVMPDVPDVVIHRDYYAANLIWDGERVWGIDIDQMALGDAAVDLGSFVAQLEKLALRTAGRTDAFDNLVSAFVRAYATRDELDDIAPRVAFFTAYMFLKLATFEVQRQRPDWYEVAAVFVGRAKDLSRAGRPES